LINFAFRKKNQNSEFVMNKNNDIADGASVAVGGIVNLKGALSGMGFE
jgi:hypothetical protein